MKQSFAIILIFLLLPLSVNADDIDVSGDWILTTNTPRGEITKPMHIEQDGSKLSITMESRNGDTLTIEGTLEGNRIQWSQDRQMRGRGGVMTVHYSGTVEGDKMSGSMTFMDREMPWSAVKKVND